MPETQVNLTIHKQTDLCIVELQDRKILEELAINQIGERLSELAGEYDKPKLLLDFKNVEHLSSAALGMLITLNKQLGKQQGQLVLANINDQILEVFKITKLNKLFNIQGSTDDAIQELS
ncbi:MAG: STAS domain-containing protein [Planctomycetota bacterium]|nr:MAG: STAS domain-containing protein [Planctomycetota bacterium]